jgi:hypothetical protein
MGQLSTDLKNMGYERTEQESPFDEEGTLWTKGFEAVCDETGFVIRGGDESFELSKENDEEYRYRYSEKVKLAGGHVSSYDWGDDGGRFSY